MIVAVSLLRRGIFVVAMAGLATADSITMTNVPLGQTPLALLEGWRLGDCGWDLYALATSAATDDYTPTGGCAGRVSAGVRDRAFYTSAVAWTTADDAVTVPFTGRLLVPLNVWVFTEMPVTTFTRLIISKRVGMDVSRAVRIFNVNRVGVAFQLPSLRTDLGRRIVQVGAATASGIAVAAGGCGMLPRLRTAGRPFYTPEAINVYYVPYIVSGGYDLKGIDCYDPNGDGVLDAPEVVFISQSSATPTTLAHEFGHALGHQGRCTEHVDWADVGYVSDCGPGDAVFDRFNLMRTTDPEAVLTDASFGAARTELSFGQAFRMNVHAGSWLNRPRGALPPLRTGTVEACVDNFGTWDPCTRLDVDAP